MGQTLQEIFERPVTAVQVGARNRGRQFRSPLLQRLNDKGRMPAGRKQVRFRTGRRNARANHALIDLLDLMEVPAQLSHQPFRGAPAGHAARQQFERLRIGGQRVRLQVFVELEPMFQVPQKLIRGRQGSVFGTGKQAGVLQACQGQQRAAVLNPGRGPAVQSLQALRQEFDVADASALQFDVDARSAIPPQVQPRRQLLIQPFPRGREFLDGGEVESGGINQRLDEIQKRAAGRPVPCGHARLDQHLQFPVTRPVFVITARAFERYAHFTQAAVRPQPQINPVTDPFGRIRRKQSGKLVGRALEEFLVGDALRSSGLAIGRVQEHQVDIGAVVQLFSAQLA